MGTDTYVKNLAGNEHKPLNSHTQLKTEMALSGGGLNGLINLRSPTGLLAINRETQIRNTDAKI